MVNIIVEGSRGKSSIVEMLTSVLHSRNIKAIGKISGKTTRVFTNDGITEIPRPNGRFFLDKENIEVLDKYPNMEHYIFENQGLSDYTMQLVHNIVRPDLILIPNVRFEHQDKLGDSIIEQAKSFAWNFRKAEAVITTETKKKVITIFEDYAKKYGVRLFLAKEKEKIPSEQSLILVDLALTYITAKGLTTEEYNKQFQKIYKNTTIHYSKERKVNYFLGAKVNDIESTSNVFEYLKSNTDKKFVFVCYLRKDRNERTIAFEKFFEYYLDDERIDRVYFFGHDLSITPKGHKKVFRIEENDYKEIYGYCMRADMVLFTAINGVCPFMENMEQELNESNKTTTQR